MKEAAHSLIQFCREKDRVCPQPLRWNELWQMLPNRQRVGNGWEPSLPLILAAWWDASDLAKMLRLAEHIEWADKHGKLEVVSRFLRSLPESDWHHLGE